MSNNFSFLIVGCGKIANIHARVLKDNLLQKDVYCIDVNKEVQQNFINSFNFKPFDKNMKYDALLICTPTDQHLKTLLDYKDYAEYFFIEKPLVNSIEEFEKMISLVNQDKLYCGLIELHNEIFIKLKSLIGKEEIISIQILRHSPEILSERVTSHAHMDLAIHDLSVLFKYFFKNNLIEKFEIIKNFKNGNFYETAEIIIKNRNFNANISVSRKTNRKIRTWRVVTSQKTYEVNLITNTIKIYDSIDPLEVGSEGFSQRLRETLNTYNLSEPAERQMSYFIDKLGQNKVDEEMITVVYKSHQLLLNN
jgi:predicted dehydrogenase